MKVPFSYLDDEIRDGFYVNPMMKCSWAAQLEVLAEIDRICKKYNLEYFAEWGSMLGCIRHGGFISWDDDLDITMKREDYMKFIKVCKEEFPSEYFVMNIHERDDYWDVMTRVVNSEHIRWDAEFMEKYHYFPFTTGVDIFPMDYLPRNKKQEELQVQLIDDVKNTADCMAEGIYTGKDLQKRLSIIESNCNVRINRKGNVRKQLYYLVENLYSLYKDEDADYLVLMALYAEGGIHHYEKEYFKHAIRMPFEYMDIPISIAYDTLLKRKYGDYMKMVRKGGSHDYPLYAKQEKYMNEKGAKLPEYHYQEVPLRDKMDGTDMQKDVVLGKIEQYLSLLNKVDVQVRLILNAGDYQTCLQLLAQCQELAVAFGNEIEKIIVNAPIYVTYLEQYCEDMYQIYQVVETATQSGDIVSGDVAYEILQSHVTNMETEFNKGFSCRKEVVFLVDRPSRFWTMKSYYDEAIANPDMDVYVIAMPYYYKSIEGNILESCYDGEKFSENISITNYNEYNLEERHPAQIYNCIPYDDYNYIYTVHPHFYTAHLRECTDELIYIPWFVLSDFDEADERAWVNMKYYVSMPALVNSNRIILQSESMKDNYVKYLTKWAGENTESLWKQKIEVNSAIPDLYIKEKNQGMKIPEEWLPFIQKADGERKKLLVFQISATGFEEHGDVALQKLEKVLHTFKEQKEKICIIWAEYPQIETILENRNSEWNIQYQKLVKEFLDKKLGVYDKSSDWETISVVGDAYYGDGSRLAHMMHVNKKPVMLQSFDVI